MADDEDIELPPSVSDSGAEPAPPSDVELPPDVLSEGGEESAAPPLDVPLPPPVGTPGRCTCRNMCYDKVSSQWVQYHREQHLKLPQREQGERHFHAVAQQVCDTDGNVKPGRTQWTLQWGPCLPAFLGVCPCSGAWSRGQVEETIAAWGCAACRKTTTASS